MNLKQMQVMVDSYQDRLVIRFVLNDNELIDVLITRRMLAESWANLLGVIDQNAGQITIPEPMPDGNALNADEQVQFEQKSGNYFYPMGKEPLLINELEVESQDDDRFLLIVREPRARQFAISLDNKGLTMLCVMLKGAAEAANWMLKLEFAGVTEIHNSPSVPVFSTPQRHLLH